MKRLNCIALTIIILVGCSPLAKKNIQSGTKNMSNHELLKEVTQKFNFENPKLDARNDFNAKKAKFLIVGGIAAVAPRTREINESKKNELGTLFIKGTTDVYENNSHANLIIKVKKYAESYNDELIKLINESN